ncbi:MAG: hypothetical protein ACLRZZ_07970 [Enterocloster sp.]
MVCNIKKISKEDKLIMKEKCLVTCGLDEFVDEQAEEIILLEENPHFNYDLFVGDVGMKVNVWKNIWMDKVEFNKDLDYLNSLQEEVLKSLVHTLNQFHGINYSTVIWDGILSPWLGGFIDAMYCKYKMISSVIQEESVYTYALTPDMYLHPITTRNFIDYAYKDEIYNEQLSTYVKEHLGINIKKRVKMNTHDNSQDILKYNDSIKQYLLKLFRRSIRFYPRNPKVILSSPHRLYLRTGDILKLIVQGNGKIGVVFNEDQEIGLPNVEYDIKQRQKMDKSNYYYKNDFEKLLYNIINENIPSCYVEGFYRIRKRAELVFRPGIEKVVSVSDWHSQEYAKSYIAFARSNGAQLYNVEIGADGNINKCRAERWDGCRVSDVFYTTGWTETCYHSKMVPFINPKTFLSLNSKRTDFADSKKMVDVLYGGTAIPLCMNSFATWTARNTKLYIEQSTAFLESLCKIKDVRVKARIYNADAGWDIKRVLGDKKIPNLQIDNWNRSFEIEVQSCRLYICDVISTTWMQACVLDIPQIIIGIPEFENFTEEGKIHIMRLKKVGIYQETYNDAIHYMANLMNIEEWWSQPQRRKAMDEFGSIYAKHTENGKDDWFKELRELIWKTY